MPTAVEISPAVLDPQSLFFVMGLEGSKRRPLRSDRSASLRLQRDMAKEASAFLVRTKPRRFAPRRHDLRAIRRFLASSLADVTPELRPVALEAQGFLMQLAPEELTSEFVPIEFVPHSLAVTKLRRAYAVLERPETLYSLCMMGGILGDEVDALMGVVPETYKLWLEAIVLAAMDHRAKDRAWQPSRLAKYQLPVLVGQGSVAIPEVGDIFAISKAKKQAADAAQSAGDVGSSEATPSQRRAAQLPSPREAR